MTQSSHEGRILRRFRLDPRRAPLADSFELAPLPCRGTPVYALLLWTPIACSPIPLLVYYVDHLLNCSVNSTSFEAIYSHWNAEMSSQEPKSSFKPSRIQPSSARVSEVPKIHSIKIGSERRTQSTGEAGMEDTEVSKVVPSSSHPPSSHPSSSSSTSESHDHGKSFATDASSSESSSEDLDETQMETDLLEQDMDLSRPITNTNDGKATPRRYTPVTRIYGDEEMQYKAYSGERMRRVFVFTPQGRAVSLQVDPKWKNSGALCVAAMSALCEPQLKMVPPPQEFSHVYFYPSMADVEDLSDIRDDDCLVVVPSKLEQGQVLNALGTTRGRSHSLSGLPPAGSTRGASSTPTSEWSNIVPVVEPSFYLSTLTFERHSTLETERFCKDRLTEALLDHQARIKSDHISDILHHIESFSSVSANPSTSASQSALGSSPSLSRPNENFSSSTASLPDHMVSTPRGGIAMLSPTHNRRSSASGSASSAPGVLIIPSQSEPLSARSYLYPVAEGSPTDHAGDSSLNHTSDVASSDMASSIVAHSPSSHALSPSSPSMSSRHGFEWERAENDIRALENATTLPNKWEDHDKSKKERNRSLTPDEEKEAKKMEKRQSKLKVAPQRGIVAALGTMPRARPEAPVRPLSSSLEAMLTSPEDIVTDANGKVIGLTLDRLVQRITSDSFLAASLSKSFLMTYRLYMTPLDLLKSLEARWDADGPPAPAPGSKASKAASQLLTPARLRLLTLLKQWAFKSAYDEMSDDAVKQALYVLAQKLERCGVVNLMKEIETGMYKKRDSATSSDDFDDLPKLPSPYLPPLGGELSDFHPLELARQITILEKGYMDYIKPQELMTLAWTKKNKETLAPNVMNMIKFSNFLVDWICTEILKPTEPIQRAMVISRFIYVGHYCLELNSFNACVEVLSALRRSSVYRLRRSWNYLSDRAWTVFEQLESLFEPDANYKNYRSVLEKVQPPCVPYIGRLLSDILFLDEKEPTMLGTGDMVNLVKLEAMASILKFLSDQQHHEYHLAPIETIVSHIFSHEVFNEKQAYNVSLERERKHESSRNTSDHPQRPELSPSALTLNDCLSRSDAFALFRAYLEQKCDSNLLLFYKSVAEWIITAKSESDQSKRTRELATLIFDAYISDKSEQQVAFAKDAYTQASIQEVEWKVKDDHRLSAHLFKPLVDAILPTLHHHFNLFRRTLPTPSYTLTS